jgi:hypothetical protein
MISEDHSMEAIANTEVTTSGALYNTNRSMVGERDRCQPLDRQTEKLDKWMDRKLYKR